MRAPFGRFGGKSLVAKKILGMFPKLDSYNTYVEPFLGAGNIFLRKKSYHHIEIINDLDQDIYNIFKKLQIDSKYIHDNVKRHIVTKDDWTILKDSDDLADIITTKKYSYNSASKAYTKRKPIKTNYLGYQDRLTNVTILNTSFETVIKEYDSPTTFFYLDPPYNIKDQQYYYNSNLLPIDIYNAVKDVKGKVMISYNDDEEMKLLFKDWNITYITMPYSKIVDNTHIIKTELVITNYIQ